MKTIFFILLAFTCFNCQGQDTLQPRAVQYYFDQLGETMEDILISKNALDDSLKLKIEYFDTVNGQLKFNKAGIEIYSNSRMEAHKKLFQTWNYQQHLSKDEFVYVLYFSIAGFEDLEWIVLRWKKEKWNYQDKLDKQEVGKIANDIEEGKSTIDLDYIPLFDNYDEGPKNLENIKIFIKNDYLVLERGNLFHSLYDLKTQKTLINKTCPWCSSNAKDKESMNEWIKTNLSDKIEKKMNESR